MGDLICTTDDKTMKFKAINSASSIQMKDAIGTCLTIQNVIQVHTRNSSGEDVISTNIFSEDGKIYATLSPTVDSSIQNMQSIFGDVIGLHIRIDNQLNTSNGRKFLTLDVIND